MNNLLTFNKNLNNDFWNINFYLTKWTLDGNAEKNIFSFIIYLMDILNK